MYKLRVAICEYKQEQNLFINCENLKDKLLLEYSFCLIIYP